MNILTGESSTELFGGDVPPQVKALLDEARTAESPERVLGILGQSKITRFKQFIYSIK